MQWQICRAETLPVRYQDPDLLSQNRILIVSSFFSRCCKSFVLDGSDRPYVIFPFGPPCEFSVFSVLTVLMCELKKIKNDFPFLKNPCFLLISSTSSFLMLYIWQIFFFIGHRLNAKRSAPAFHLLTPICPDFSAIANYIIATIQATLTFQIDV